MLDPEGAVGALGEAVELDRELVETEREAHLPHLATSLNNFSNVLAGVGRDEESFAAAEESVKYRRELVELDRGEYLPNLATGLINFSNAYERIGNVQAALRPVEEAIEIYKELSGESGERHLEDLTSALSNLSAVLSILGRDEALPTIEEAIGYQRRLVEEDADRYLPDLAGYLNNLSNIVDSMGFSAQALVSIEEAIGYHRQLVRENPERYLPDLAMSLNNYMTVVGQLGRLRETQPAAEEAIGYYRRLARENPQRYLPDLAMSLSNYANVLSELKRYSAAAKASEEAIDYSRRLVEVNRPRFLPDLAMSLNNYSSIMLELGRGDDALAAIEEAVAQRRDLVESDRKRFLPDLATSLNALASVLGYAERAAEALEPSGEAITYFRELVELSRPRHLPDLVRSLATSSLLLSHIGKIDASDKAVEEAIELQGEQVTAGSSEHLALFVDLISMRGSELKKQGRGAETIPLLEKVLDEHEDLKGFGPVMLMRAALHAEKGELPQAIGSALDALQLAEEAADPLQLAPVRTFLRRQRSTDSGRFESAWSEAAETEEPVWLRHHDTGRELWEIGVDWMTTGNVEESRQFLTDHATELLTDAGEATLTHIDDFAPGQDAARERLRILRAARASGVDAAHDALTEERRNRRRLATLNHWISLKKGAREFLTENVELLLDPRCEEDLFSLVDRQPADPSPFAWIGLLGLTRADGPDVAFEALSMERPPPKDSASLASATEEKALHLSRLWAALEPEDHERQFQHALAAMAAGRVEEAQQAMDRCNALLAAWERKHYLRRLDGIGDGESVFAGEIATLKGGLSAPSGDA